MKSWDEFYASLTKRGASAQLIIENTDHELLVVKAHYKPYWSLPGGIVDANETPRAAAIREVKEEVGLHFDSTEVELAATIVRRSRRAITYLFVFRSRVVATQQTTITIDNKEIVDFAWVSKHDVAANAHGRHFNRAVKNWASDTPEVYVESTNTQ